MSMKPIYVSRETELTILFYRNVLRETFLERGLDK